MKQIFKRYGIAILVGVFLLSVALCIVAVETTQYVPGDVNNDGVVDTADIITLRRYLNGEQGLTYQEIALDISNDGIVDESDIMMLRRFVVGGYGTELRPNMPEVEPEEPADNTEVILRLRSVSEDIGDNMQNFKMAESLTMMYSIKLCVDEIILQYDTVGITEAIDKAYLKKYYSGYEDAYVDVAKENFMIIKNNASKKAKFQEEVADMRAGTINWLLDAFDIDKSEILG